jgi:exosortase
MSDPTAAPSVTTIRAAGIGIADAATLAAYLLLLGFLAAPLWELTVGYWLRTGNEAYTHAPLMPVIAAYFIWEWRRELVGLPVRVSKKGLAFLIFAAAVFLVGTIGAERFTMQVGIISLLVGLLWTHFGNAITKRLLFPISLFYLMIPLPGIIYRNLSFNLQILSSKLAVDFMQLFALPVYREGNIINLSYTQLEVAEACSGITSLVSLATVGWIFAYIAQKRFWPRVILVVSSIPIAMLMNAFRIAGTGMLAHFWSIKAAEGFFHSFAGWLVFMAAFVILLVENGIIVAVQRWRRRSKETGA